MAGIPARASIVTDLHSRTRAVADWKARLASAGLVAILLAIGTRRRRDDFATDQRAADVAAVLHHLTAKQFVLELYQRISDDRIISISAGVTFFLLLAIFPATAAIVSIYGF